MDDTKYFKLYKELEQASMQLKPYYDIDKIKPYAVYVWTKDKDSRNVFDIFEDEIHFYEQHQIASEAMEIITQIQEKLKEMTQLLD